ncbi:hypothetical protein KAFR_0B04150 [Kazachstania africana CBS 2517]|uniref:Uncharacterized protein n=1 Tax=Kazachstania africana (strain ATCC 22294 / BCRC 22015 / CBS 2517 / CECT 1963 / NBRC 1671 / NRRL Y-8276) TaxID=1071382 RepID=H2AQR1_KAZAF|nr:hypothetical protein KAFR_0B04150 [Kazachstania africana CBS 2517]CCF56711.1 hypothetical protein KAFR_0B04150 [Kazachstania africana CBS 2517]
MFCNVLEFEAPKLNLMQFFSLDPISLALPEKELHNSKKVTLDNVKKIMYHKSYFNFSGNLPQSINLLNLYYTHLNAFSEKYSHLIIGENRLSEKLFSILLKCYQHSFLSRVTSRLLFYLLMSLCFIAQNIYLLLHWSYFPIVTISATLQQIDLRCQQIAYFPVQYLKINKNVTIRKALPRFRSYSEASASLRSELPCKFYPDYIRLYNTIWLIVNDVSFGLIIGAILHDQHDQLVNIVASSIQFCCYDSIKKITIFLSNNPFGIKLNEELASFLSELFLWIIEFTFNGFAKYFVDKSNLSWFLSLLTQIMCLSGASFGLSLIMDFFSILSLHLYLFYHISGKLYHWQLNCMISLFYLFCGKKRNVLRDRIDHHFFELDQLLMGTLLFLILVFLMPTVLAFYICYTILRLMAMCVEIFLESIIGLINHFPLFALLLRIKDPKRLPGGISINWNRTEPGLTIFTLENNPLKISRMFRPYSILMSKIRYNYFSSYTARQILKGLPLTLNRTKLYHVLYFSLPDGPIKARDIYAKLSDALANP